MKTNRELLDAKLTEAQWSKTVEGLLNTYQWKWVHFRPARTEKGWRTAVSGHKGFPDYVAVKDGRFLLIELKSEAGKLSEEQLEWWHHLNPVAAIEGYIWRPSDYDCAEQVLGHGISGVPDGHRRLEFKRVLAAPRQGVRE